MNAFDFWEHIRTFGQMTNGWWYSVAALPAAIIAVCTYLLMWFALRRVEKLSVIFLSLVIASVPLVLVLPSYYVSTSVRDAIERIGYEWPADTQHLSLTNVRQIGGDLNWLATLGIIGASLSIVIIFASMQIGGYAPPVVQAISQSLTKAVTRAFGNRRGVSATVSSRYGVIRVTRGQQQGSKFGITNGAVIGKVDATMIITDDIVSRRHARFEIRNELPYLIDESSKNGTFLVRGGDIHDVDSRALQLQSGDKIYLGHPEEPEAVELTFEKPAGGAV
jgi:hypothetical protein